MADTNAPTSTASKYTPKGIPIAAIIDYIENKGLTISETAKVVGCDKGNIHQRLAKIGLKPGYLERYKKNRADILAAYQVQILNSLTPDDLKKAGLSQKAMAYGVLFDKERLERGQSTENVAYADMVRAQELADKRIEAYESRFGGGEAKTVTHQIA